MSGELNKRLSAIDAKNAEIYFDDNWKPDEAGLKWQKLYDEIFDPK